MKFNVCYRVLLILVLTTSKSLLAQWVQANGPYGGVIACFAVSGTNIFTGTSGGGVFLSTNNGASWTMVNSGLTNANVRSLTVSGVNIFAGTYGGGVFISTNNGASWTAVNSGLTNTDVRSLTVSDANLFAGTYCGGVWRCPMSELVALDEASAQKPGSFDLLQNFPNPFNPTTTIKFDLPNSSNVTLKIYNLLGQEERTLVSGNKQAGYHTVIWDGKNNQGAAVSSGVYLYRLQTGEYSKTMKLMMLK